MTENHGDTEAATLMAMLKEFAAKRGMALVPAQPSLSAPVSGDQPQLFDPKHSPAPKPKRPPKVVPRRGMDSFCKIGDRIEVKYPDGKMRILSVTKVTRYVMHLANTSSEFAIKKSELAKARKDRHVITDAERAMARPFRKQ